MAASGLLKGVEEAFHFNGRDLSTNLCKLHRNVPVERQKFE